MKQKSKLLALCFFMLIPCVSLADDALDCLKKLGLSTNEISLVLTGKSNLGCIDCHILTRLTKERRTRAKKLYAKILIESYFGNVHPKEIRLAPDIKKECDKEKIVDPNLMRGILRAEDGRKTSTKGARGDWQFMPKTAKELGFNPLDEKQSLQGAVRYYSYLLKVFNYSHDLALAAWNFGVTHVLEGKRLPKETRDFIVQVKRNREYYSAIYGAS